MNPRNQPQRFPRFPKHKRRDNDIYTTDVKVVAGERFIGSFFHLLDTHDPLYTLKIRSKYAFLYSFSYLTITNYPIAHLFTRMNNYIPYFFQTLLIDFDNKNLHHMYKYRSFIDKLALRTHLLNHEINEYTIQFIVDYFDINLIMNDMNTRRIKYYLPRNMFDVYKPSILMYKNKERHYPLFFHNARILTSASRFQWKLYMNYIQSDIQKFKFVSTLNIKLYSMKLHELQELAKEHNISIKKLSKNNKHVANKTKLDLKNDIKQKLKLVN